jgi:hypothetical protein
MWKACPWKNELKLGHVRQGTPRTSRNITNLPADFQRPTSVIQNAYKIFNLLIHFQTLRRKILLGPVSFRPLGARRPCCER